MNRKLTLRLAITSSLLIVLWALAWFLSPHIYGSSVLTAAETNNLGVLVSRVDGERLKNSAAEDLTQIAVSAIKLPEGKEIPDALKSALTSVFKKLNSIDDRALVEMVANLIRGNGFISKDLFSITPKEFLQKRSAMHSGAYGATMDTYIQKVTFKETGEELALLFERNKLFTWRLVAVKTNSSTVLLPFKISK